MPVISFKDGIRWHSVPVTALVIFNIISNSLVKIIETCTVLMTDVIWTVWSLPVV